MLAHGANQPPAYFNDSGDTSLGDACVTKAMKNLLLPVVAAISLNSGFAQEPFTYKADDFKGAGLPEGMTAEDYMNKVYQENHYKIKVTFRVIGEDGVPVPNADINVGIDSLLHADGHNNYKGKTNAEGLFTVESRGRGCTDVLVEKDGFYPSRPEVEWDGDLNPGGEIMHKNGGFRPWNPTIDVVLKKVGKPIPMIVRLADGGSSSRMKPTPEMLGRDLGWDLVEGDWIAPHGDGKTADLTVRFESDFIDESNRSASAVVSFGNLDDGLIPITEVRGEASFLKFPRMAPEGGYKLRKLEYSQTVKDGVLDAAPERKPEGYFFRLRTKLDKDGQVESAIYGKITKPFELKHSSFRGDSRLFLKFDYYLNPTPNDRNLEYDQKNNLAPEADKDLRWPP